MKMNINENVPSDFKELGFNLNDTVDMVYLGKEDNSRFLFSYNDYDKTGKGDFTFFQEITYENEKLEISLNWYDIDIETIRDLFSKDYDVLDYVFNRMYKSGGENGILRFVKYHFPMYPVHIKFHNF